MSSVNDAVEKVRERIQDGIDSLRKKVFGANNEHLDFVMDSFYKLAPPQRNAVLAGIISGIILFVMAAVGLYFSRVNSLKSELNDTFAAIHEIRGIKKDLGEVEARFDSLVSAVDKRTNDLKIKPFFEKLAKQEQVVIEGLVEQKAQLPADNPLAAKMEENLVEMRLPKISIPRLLNFLIEIEKADKYLRIQDLKIQGRYGTKLYFDGTVKIRGYSIVKR
jgi:hypothetical protein